MSNPKTPFLMVCGHRGAIEQTASVYELNGSFRILC